MEKEELKSAIQQMPDFELFPLLYTVLAQRKVVRKDYGEIDDAYSIAVSGYSDRDGVHETELWALPEEGIENFTIEFLEKGPNQSGTCLRCKVSVICVSKNAICPICDTIVSCT
jgi:hypothetical protein